MRCGHGGDLDSEGSCAFQPAVMPLSARVSLYHLHRPVQQTASMRALVSDLLTDKRIVDRRSFVAERPVGVACC
jgi:hypothetical protein